MRAVCGVLSLAFWKALSAAILQRVVGRLDDVLKFLSSVIAELSILAEQKGDPFKGLFTGVSPDDRDVVGWIDSSPRRERRQACCIRPSSLSHSRQGGRAHTGFDANFLPGDFPGANGALERGVEASGIELLLVRHRQFSFGVE